MDAKTLCLAVLSHGPASGYEIKKALEEAPFSHFQDTSFGSIYPALNRLAEEGSIKGTAMAQAKRPDKKVYALTETGEQQLIEALGEPPGPDRFRSDFLFVLFHADLLSPEHVARIIDARLAFYRERIARMKQCGLCDRPSGARFVHGFGLAMYEAAARYLEAEREEFLSGLSGGTRMVAE